MSYDFNSAEKQSSMDLIPVGSIVPLVMTIRPGGSGDGGWLKASNSSDAQMLDCEFTVAEGPYAKRKLWQYLVLSGGKQNEHGESIAGGITRSTLRAILESARDIKPDDHSDAAVNARRINGWQDFCGLTFVAKIGIEKDKTGQYQDKNRIQAVITPDMKNYGGSRGGNGGAPAQLAAPAWSASPASQPPLPTVPPKAANPIPAWAR